MADNFEQGLIAAMDAQLKIAIDQIVKDVSDKAAQEVHERIAREVASLTLKTLLGYEVEQQRNRLLIQVKLPDPPVRS